jgi:glutamine cyclotransferase
MLSCSCDRGIDDIEDDNTVILQIQLPKQKAQYIQGQELSLTLDVNEDYPNANLKIYIADSLWVKQKGVKKNETFSFSTLGWGMGYNKIKVELEGILEEILVKTVEVVVFANSPAQILMPEIKKTYPHSTKHYTQGFEFYQGKLFEGTGQYRESIIAEINLATGNAKRIVQLGDEYFGEGITIIDNEIFQLTWTNKICFVYDVNTLQLKRQLTYDGEGWGLANNGKEIIMSNGSTELVFRDPKTFKILKKIQVFSDQQEYRALNELEFVDGFIYANVYQQEYIVKIDPKNGQVVALIDAAELVKLGRGVGEVLNGIAFNQVDGLFYLTGKNWEKTFAVALKNKVDL